MLDRQEERIIQNRLSSLDELDKLEAREKAEKEKAKQEAKQARLTQIVTNISEANMFFDSSSFDPKPFMDIPVSF